MVLAPSINNKIEQHLVQLTTGIADDAHVPGSEENILERHRDRALLVVGHVYSIQCRGKLDLSISPGHEKVKVPREM